MKRDFFIKNTVWVTVGKWLISFLISSLVLMILMLILTAINTSNRMNDNVLRLILMIVLCLSSGICAYIFRRITNIKGVFCGLITAGIFSLIKLCMTLSSGGIDKSNVMIYICIVCVSVIGGILSANNRRGKAKELGKMNKSKFI